MKPAEDAKTELLLSQASEGDQGALEGLVAHYRSRLRNMVKLRLDSRLARRVDPSDIVQEALVDAYRKFPEYLKTRPLPFYPWLRQLALERLVVQIRRHLGAQARSVLREEPLYALASEESASALATCLLSRGADPLGSVLQREDDERVRQALQQLSPDDREILLLRFVEQTSTNEAAAILKVAPGTVGSRQFRALKRIKAILEKDQND